MANYNIKMNMLNSSGGYDVLYPDINLNRKLYNLPLRNVRDTLVSISDIIIAGQPEYNDLYRLKGDNIQALLNYHITYSEGPTEVIIPKDSVVTYQVDPHSNVIGCFFCLEYSTTKVSTFANMQGGVPLPSSSEIFAIKDKYGNYSSPTENFILPKGQVYFKDETNNNTLYITYLTMCYLY